MAKPLDPFTGVNSADPILQASTQVQIYMSSSNDDLNELSLLMELPGLWPGNATLGLQVSGRPLL